MKGDYVVRIQCPHMTGLGEKNRKNSKRLSTSGWHDLNKEKKKKGRINLKFYGWPLNPKDFMYMSCILEE
jgi:hypothetical protein